MTQRYRVVGGLPVAGVVNGAEVTQEALDEAGANVPALLYAGHLEPVVSAPRRKRGAKDGGDDE